MVFGILALLYNAALFVFDLTYWLSSGSAVVGICAGINLICAAVCAATLAIR